MQAAALDQSRNGETRFAEMIFPEQSNHYGTLFGGTALSLMGKAAFIAASRCSRRAVVMAASEKVEFHVPVKVGQMVELAAAVERLGRSSMTVVVDVIVETLLTGERQLAMRGRFEMVAVDVDGRPIPIAAGTSDAIAAPVASIERV